MFVKIAGRPGLKLENEEAVERYEYSDQMVFLRLRLQGLGLESGNYRWFLTLASYSVASTSRHSSSFTLSLRHSF